MRSELVVLGLIACATRVFAQGAAPEAQPVPPVTAALPAEPAPPAEPALRPNRPPEDDVLGFVLGFEGGIAVPGGTTATTYDRGFGTGFVGGFHYKRFALELHVHERFALTATDPQLRGETTLGSLSVGSALLRVELLDRPILEIMAGPAMLSTPIFAVNVDDLGDQRVEGMALEGIGVMAGAAIGMHVTSQVALTFEVRALLASHWELPGRGWVVPTTVAPDGGRMFSVARGDATGDARTATILLRVFL